MTRTILGIEGMSCGMCESHINDTIRREFNVKKVKSSHKKNQTEILSVMPLDEAELRRAIDATGYKVVSFTAEEA